MAIGSQSSILHTVRSLACSSQANWSRMCKIYSYWLTTYLFMVGASFDRPNSRQLLCCMIVWYQINHNYPLSMQIVTYYVEHFQINRTKTNVSVSDKHIHTRNESNATTISSHNNKFIIFAVRKIYVWCDIFCSFHIFSWIFCVSLCYCYCWWIKTFALYLRRRKRVNLILEARRASPIHKNPTPDGPHCIDETLPWYKGTLCAM